MPILRPDGSVFGTLCALDPEPKRCRTVDLETFELLASLVAEKMESVEVAEERERFLDAVGHDMRTPLQTIAISTELVESRLNARSETRAATERITRSTQRLSRMMNDLADLTRGRLGRRMALTSDPVVVGELLRGIVSDLPQAGRSDSIRLEVEGDERVTWDSARIVQMIVNLVSNAFHHGAPDEPVTVRFEGTGEPVTLSVHNWGETLAPGTLARLFDPFYRSPSTRSEAGLGLGLYIVEQIARAHGGEVAVRSSREAGTEFLVRLPRHVPPG